MKTISYKNHVCVYIQQDESLTCYLTEKSCVGREVGVVSKAEGFSHGAEWRCPMRNLDFQAIFGGKIPGKIKKEISRREGE
jgi:hypothetical protein